MSISKWECKNATLDGLGEKRGAERNIAHGLPYFDTSRNGGTTIMGGFPAVSLYINPRGPSKKRSLSYFRAGANCLCLSWLWRPSSSFGRGELDRIHSQVTKTTPCSMLRGCHGSAKHGLLVAGPIRQIPAALTSKFSIQDLFPNRDEGPMLTLRTCRCICAMGGARNMESRLFWGSQVTRFAKRNGRAMWSCSSF